MVIWGAIWGAVLGLLWHGPDEGLRMVVGALLGAFAGWTLRNTVRKEIARTLPAPTRAPVAEIVTAPAPLPTTAPIAATPPRPRATPAPTRAPEPDFVTLAFQKAWAWLLGGNTVVRAGVLVLFIGLAFLAKYAVEHALLPPELRLAAIGAVGIGLFVAGFRLRGKRADRAAYAVTLQGAGVAVLYLTVFAAFRLYHFLPATAAFAALGLVCAFSAVIAMVQNTMAMAFIGFAGGFAAPVLVSTGEGNHVALFTYYTLLGVAIAAIAVFKAWRALNLLGFFATFGIATVWGVLKYQSADFASTEPFLVGFFVIYLVASLLYALRHSLEAKQAIDATLVFGVPIAAFSLQAALVHDMRYGLALSSLLLGALYIGLGWIFADRRGGRPQVNLWLAQCFAALGLGFVTLTVPLALDERWTSAVWAVEGAAVYWMAQRQGRWMARAFGLALQLLAAFLYAGAWIRSPGGGWPFANPQFLGALMLSASAFAIAWWSREWEPVKNEARSDVAAGFRRFEAGLSPVLFWAGFLVLQFGLFHEIGRHWPEPGGILMPLFAPETHHNLRMIVWVVCAFGLHWLALQKRRRPWPIAATPAWTVMPVMLLFALEGMALHDHVFQGGGWAAWPIAAVLHLTMLHRLDAGVPQGWWRAVHAANVWLAVLLLGNLLVFAIGRAHLWQTAWASVILLAAGIAVMLVLARKRMFAAVGKTTRWPLDRFATSYLWVAAAPLAALLALGALVVAVHSRGNADPLPYIPLLNPTDLAIALALLACTTWLMRVRETKALPADFVRAPWPLMVLGAIAFIAINTVWLRVAHHFAGVPWDAEALFESFLVQAGYSLLWTVLALVLMVGAHRRALRPMWMTGAALLGLTVLKLFVIDLSNRGGSERIFVFIGVGLLMLVVGWFAPLPPAARRVEVQP